MKGGGIWQVILLLFAASLIAGVIQLAIIFLIVWGLLFRTREAIGMLAFLFMLGVLDRHPWAAIGGLALITVLALLPSRAKAVALGNERLPPPSG